MNWKRGLNRILLTAWAGWFGFFLWMVAVEASKRGLDGALKWLGENFEGALLLFVLIPAVIYVVVLYLVPAWVRWVRRGFKSD